MASNQDGLPLPSSHLQQSSSSNYESSSPLPPPSSSTTASSCLGFSPSLPQQSEHQSMRASSFSSSNHPNPALLRMAGGIGRGGAEMEGDYHRRGSAFASLGGSPLMEGLGGNNGTGGSTSPYGGGIGMEDSSSLDQYRRGSHSAYTSSNMENMLSARASSVSAQGSSKPSNLSRPSSSSTNFNYGSNGNGIQTASALNNLKHSHLVPPNSSGSTASSPLSSNARSIRGSYAEETGSSSPNPSNSSSGGPDALAVALAFGSLNSYGSSGTGTYPSSPSQSQISHASGSALMSGNGSVGLNPATGMNYSNSNPTGINVLDGLYSSAISSNQQSPSFQPPVSTALHGPLSMSDPRTQLAISNLPYRVRWQDLKDLFRKAGVVLRADVSLTQDNRSLGNGTVLMATEEDAMRAIEMFKGFCWQGRNLDVGIDRSGTLLSTGPIPGMTNNLSSPNLGVVNAVPLNSSPGIGSIQSSNFQTDQQGTSSPNPSAYSFLTTGTSASGSVNGSQHAGNHSHSHSSAGSVTGGLTSGLVGSTSFPNGIGGSTLPPPHGMLQQQHQQQHMSQNLHPPAPSGWGSAGGPTIGNSHQSNPMHGGGRSHIPSGWGKAASGNSNTGSQRSSIAAQGGLGGGAASGFTQAQVQNATQLQAQVAALHPYLQQALGFSSSNPPTNANPSYGAGQGSISHQNHGAGGYAFPSNLQQNQHPNQLQSPQNQQPGPSSYYGRVLFVGNLPFHCQWQDLKDLFRAAGNIQRADVALGPEGRSRGFGTVLFSTVEDAQNAVRIYHGYEYSGRTLKVHFDRFAQTMVPPGSGTPGTPSQYTAAFAATQPPSHVNHSNLKQREPPPPPAQYNQQQQSHQQRLQHLYQQQQQHVQSQQHQVQQVQQQQLMNPGGISNFQGQEPQSFSAFGLPPTSQQQSQWGGMEQYGNQNASNFGSNSSKAPTSSDMRNVSTSTSTSGTGAPHPGRIAMPPSAFSGVVGAMSPIQMRSSVPMTPGMPGFTFQAIPQTPPLHPQFLSPGLGPFSPPFGSPHFNVPLQSGPPTPFAQPFINPAPGAPLHQQMQQNVTTPGATQNYHNPMFPAVTGAGDSYPPPYAMQSAGGEGESGSHQQPATPHWSQPAQKNQASKSPQVDQQDEEQAIEGSAVAEGTQAEEDASEEGRPAATRTGSHSPKTGETSMPNEYPFPVVTSNQSNSFVQRRASTNSPVGSPLNGPGGARHSLHDSLVNGALLDRRGSMGGMGITLPVNKNRGFKGSSSHDDELSSAVSKMLVSDSQDERSAHPLARENSDPNLTLQTLRLQQQQQDQTEGADSALSTSQSGTPT